MHTFPVSDSVKTDDAARLSAESAQFQAHLTRLSELEDRKRELSPTDPEFVVLARDIEDLAGALLGDARGQTQLGEAAHQDGVSTPIVDVPDTLTAVQILAQWREAERELDGEPTASARARELRMAIDAYRRAYQRVFDQTHNR
jgi:hypothetical protein